MTGFQGDSEQFFQLIQQYRIVIPRARARARSAAVGRAAMGRASMGVRAWLPSDLTDSTRWFNPDQEIGAYNSRTDVFTPATSGTATYFKWVGSTNATLLQTSGTNMATGLTISNHNFGGGRENVRVVETTLLQNVRASLLGGQGDDTTGENLFMAFVCKVSNFASKGFLSVKNFPGTRGYEAEFNSLGIPVFKFKNNTESETTESHTGSFAPTSGQYQVHVIQRFGNKLIWTIDGTKCIDATTSYLGGAGNNTLHLFKKMEANSEPDYGLAEFFKNNSSATTEIDRIKAEGYLAHKYLIDLPRGHRYKKSAPGV